MKPRMNEIAWKIQEKTSALKLGKNTETQMEN
jgi:hypothetical protein